MGYHLVNFTIHFFNSLWVYAFVRLLFQTPRGKGVLPAESVPSAALFAALFQQFYLGVLSKI